jgi:hypothetical protein
MRVAAALPLERTTSCSSSVSARAVHVITTGAIMPSLGKRQRPGG